MWSKATARAKGEPTIPSSTVGYFFREALRRIWISKRNSLVAIGMIAMSLFIVGLFLLISENLTRAVNLWGGQSHLTIYMRDDATPEQVRSVDTFLSSRSDLARRRFISREAALAKFRSFFTSLSPVVSELDRNPFPESFEVQVTPQIIESKSFSSGVAALKRLPGVDHVQFDWEWVARLRRIIGVINSIGFVTGGLVALAAAFMIANVIRLTMVLYREEIEIMRLVGATETMIRGPFFVEGLLQGAAGGVLAVALLYSLFIAAQRYVTPTNPVLWDFLLATFLPWRESLALVAGAVVAGLLGSWLSLRERA
ncbi:MAG TPA: permease-like cell division protein FtsX [Thermoanaerobaculia bacterium]|nr:permease-like cell division protein FtsX [Thermoanaerobaculia bacterium]